MNRSLLTFLNEPKLICLQIGKWFPVLLFNFTNSILYQ